MPRRLEPRRHKFAEHILPLQPVDLDANVPYPVLPSPAEPPVNAAVDTSTLVLDPPEIPSLKRPGVSALFKWGLLQLLLLLCVGKRIFQAPASLLFLFCVFTCACVFFFRSGVVGLRFKASGYRRLLPCIVCLHSAVLRSQKLAARGGAVSAAGRR